MRPLKAFSSRVIPLLVNNIDTDQIIPARFLKVTDKNGLAENLFADWRYGDDGTPRPDFVLNKLEHKGASILLAGDNFGCGSSREHAPWALAGFGIRAVISTSFADIFSNNALKNGLLPLCITAKAHALLTKVVEGSPAAMITVNLGEQCVTLPDGTACEFPIDPFSKTCLMNGVDELGYLLGLEEKIAAYEHSRSREMSQ
jgi:3-isopropylmalate/(R)-2-methylmalate dehydratase small subunit